MVERALSLTYSNHAVGAETCLLLEQRPWNKDVGKTSEMQAILAISAAAHGGRWPEVFCGGLNGLFNATVYVYPCDDTLFQFKVSHGFVSGHLIEVLYRDEIIQASFELQHRPDYPVKSMANMSWLGQCYDHGGAVVSHPAAEYSNGIITLSRPVYGSLRVRYTVFRHSYNIQISKRAAAFENKYQAVAFVVFDGGVKWIDIEAPAGFEQFDGDCGNGAFYGYLDENGVWHGLQDGYNNGDLSQSHICHKSSHKIPKAVGADRSIHVDYCTQQVTSDTVSENVDWTTVDDPCDD